MRNFINFIYFKSSDRKIYVCAVNVEKMKSKQSHGSET
jgi:hypothetical protein